MNDSICASICAGTFLKQTKPITMTLEQAKKASNILDRINIANEGINRLKFDEIDSISFNKISGNICINQKDIVESIKHDTILFLKHEIEYLTKQLKDL